jgi:hypothetical protein
MLADEIYPIIKKTVPRVVRPMGSEDAEELVQDAAASAAEMVEIMEKSGRDPLPRSIAYYSIQRTKSGRRSYGDKRMDILSAGFQMDNDGALSSLEEPLGGDDEGSLTLGDMIAERREDPAAEVTRKLDWEEFSGRQDKRKQRIISEISAGLGTGEIAKLFLISPARIVQLKREIAKDIKSFMGDNILVESGQESVWERDLRCIHEKRESRFADFERTDDPGMVEIREKIFG